MHSVCFTGHRPNDTFDKSIAYEHATWKPLLDALCNLDEQLYHLGVTKFITGGAQGVDQIAFWAAYRLKGIYPDIAAPLYRPFPEQDRVWRGGGAFSSAEYQQILAKADYVHSTVDALPTEKRDIVGALMKRNTDMLDDADILIAVHWEDPNWQSVKHGGTINTMKQAAKRNMPIIAIDPKTLKLWAPVPISADTLDWCDLTKLLATQ